MADDLFQQEMLWPDQHEGPYLLRVTMTTTDGHDEVIGVELWGTEPPAAGRFARWGEKALERWRESVGVPMPIQAHTLRLPLARLADDLTATRARALEIAHRAPPEGRKRGRPPLHDQDHYKQVATVYTLAQRRGLPPVISVAQYFRVSRWTAVGWVRRARHMTLLPPKGQ